MHRFDFQKCEPSGIIGLHQFHVTKSNYTKRKHVFKLTTCAPKTKPPSPQPVGMATINTKTEFLIQTEDQSSFELWKNALQTGYDSKVINLSFYINLFQVIL